MKRSSKILITTTAVIGLSTAALSFAGGWGGGQGCRHGGYGPGYGYGMDPSTMQGQPGMGPGYMQGQRGMGPGGMRGPRGMDPELRAERHGLRIEMMKSRLGITAEQEPAWEAFTAVLNENMASMSQRFAERGNPATVEERTTRMRDRAERMAKMADAIETFYAELTPEQQQLADRFVPMRMGGRF